MISGSHVNFKKLLTDIYFLTINLRHCIAWKKMGRIAQSVACLTTDACLTAVSLIPARSHTFVEIDQEIISTNILLASADSKRVVSYKRKYVQEVHVNRLVKLAQE